METTRDGWMGGRLVLRQPRKGYRAGMDAALLAAACDLAGPMAVLELGCGVGAVLLAIAARAPDARLTGLERDAEAAALARANAAANGREDRIDIRDGDIAEGRRAVGAAAFDRVLANPPFFDDPGALRAPHPARRGAWIADDGLAAWIALMLATTRPKGALILLHRAERLGDILAALARRAGSVQVRPVHPFTDADAKRVIVRAVKGGRAPMRLLPPLVLHPREGAKHTAEAEAILRGEALLAWR